VEETCDYVSCLQAEIPIFMSGFFNFVQRLFTVVENTRSMFLRNVADFFIVVLAVDLTEVAYL
jgi:hypothetical protein